MPSVRLQIDAVGIKAIVNHTAAPADMPLRAGHILKARMNWENAVVAMRNGCHVRQLRQMYSHEVDVELPEFIIPNTNSTTRARVYEVGNSGCKLVNALTDMGSSVTIFVDIQTERIFMPTDEQKRAADWIIVGNY